MQPGDPPVAEDSTTIRKRKLSSDNLVDPAFPPGPQQKSVQDGELTALSRDNGHPLANKRLRPSSDAACAIRNQNVNDNGPDQPHIYKLPPEILQYIFCLLGPASLGRLICVSQSFRSLLDPRKSIPQSSGKCKIISMKSQDTIWESARRIWLPSAPRPMLSMDEYQMLSLLCNKSCQFCGKRPETQQSTLTSSQWTCGPGLRGVRIIWPFGVRSCSDCLRQKLKKESEMILSSDSILIPGLPFACFTSSLDYVSSTVVRQSNFPLDLQVGKYFFEPQVHKLNIQAQEARSYGQAAAEEWYRALEKRGRDVNSDAARLEQWEMIGGPILLETQVATSKHRTTTLTSPRDQAYLPSQISSTGTSTPRSDQTVRLISNHPRTESISRSLLEIPPMPLPQFAPAPGQQVVSINPEPASSLARTPRDLPRTKPNKTPQEIEQLLIEKKAEIERRCRALVPPLLPDTLERLDAFNVAIQQIPFELNEHAWETLKVRLLQQRRALDLEFEVRESRVVAPVPGEIIPSHRSNEYILSKIDQPTNKRICELADEYITQYFRSQPGLNYATTPKFAADVLQHVRRQFYQRQAQEDELRHYQRIGPLPEIVPGTVERLLNLQHMRLVFEKSIKPYTEVIRKDIFVCSECDINAAKYLMFDSMIQHFAAKHTHEFSRGASSVWWKAPWPEYPPFKQDPERFLSAATHVHQTHTLSHHPTSIFSAGSVKTVEKPTNSNYSNTAFSSISDWGQTSAVKEKTASWASSSAAGRTEDLYSRQRDLLAVETKSAWDTWDFVAKSSRMPDSLRLYVIIHQSKDAFLKSFANPPGLALFKDCLNNNHELKSLRDLANIECKACNESTLPYIAIRSVTGVQHSPPGLLDHFQSHHMERGSSHAAARGGESQRSNLDWKDDMIQLPNSKYLNQMSHNPQLSQSMKDLVNNAFITSLTAENARQPSVSRYEETHAYQHSNGRSMRPMGVELQEHSPNFATQHNQPATSCGQSVHPHELTSVANRVPYYDYRPQQHIPARQTVFYSEAPQRVRSPNLSDRNNSLVSKSNYILRREGRLVHVDDRVDRASPTHEITGGRQARQQDSGPEPLRSVMHNRSDAQHFLDTFDTSIEEEDARGEPDLVSNPRRTQPLSHGGSSLDHLRPRRSVHPDLLELEGQAREVYEDRETLRQQTTHEEPEDQIMHDLHVISGHYQSPVYLSDRRTELTSPGMEYTHGQNPVFHISDQQYRRPVLIPSRAYEADERDQQYHNIPVRYVDQYSSLHEPRHYRIIEDENEREPHVELRGFSQDRHPPIEYVRTTRQSLPRGEMVLQRQPEQYRLDHPTQLQYSHETHQDVGPGRYETVYEQYRPSQEWLVSPIQQPRERERGVIYGPYQGRQNSFQRQ